MQNDDSTARERRVRVLFPTPLDRPFDYLPPEGAAATAFGPGDFVLAPFSGRDRIGVVWPDAATPAAGAKNAFSLKRLVRRLPAAPLSADLIDFVEWAAAYTMAPLGAALRLVVRSGETADPPAPVRLYARADGGVCADLRLTDARVRALDAAAGPPRTVAEIASAAAVGEGVVRGLVRAGALVGEAVDLG